jgi:hypothetical protein
MTLTSTEFGRSSIAVILVFASAAMSSDQPPAGSDETAEAARTREQTADEDPRLRPDSDERQAGATG